MLKQQLRLDFFLSVLLGVFILNCGGTAFSALAQPENSRMVFKKVELRTTYGAAEQGKKGKLAVTPESIRFVKKNERVEFFSIPAEAVTDLFYSRVSGRRIKTAIVVSPLLLFSKGKKHYLTITFDDGAGIVGAVEFKLHKSNYRGVLRALESVTGVTMQFDQEGIKDEKETVATRSGADPDAATVELSSTPENAEIEIDGAYAGTTPRTKRLKPGEYKIKIKKKGFKKWERKIKVEGGEKVPIHVELEKK